MMNSIAHPIDYRYGDKKLRELFSPANIIKTYAFIETIVAETQAEMGIIPKTAAEHIKKAAEKISYEEVIAEEKKVKHDLMALVNIIARKAGEWGEYVHWGLTSSDVKDTAMALLLKNGLEVIEKKLVELMILLAKRSYEFINLPCVGRTHGVHANIYLFGHKFSVYLDEILRHFERLQNVKKYVLVGKFSGAVGIHTALGEIGEEFEQRALSKLGIFKAEITTQIVPRDGLAELLFIFSLISSTLDKFAVEIRNLQRTEINEVSEPFREKQVGSSAMPHKKNPIMSENISGLARIIRSLVIAALENIVLWHERDLSNSSTERILLPEIFLLLSEQLDKAIKILHGLFVNKEKILENIWLTNGLVFSEALMMALARKGLGRQKAHSLVRELSLRALNERRSFRKVVMENEIIKKYLSKTELESIFDPYKYIQVAKKRILHLIQKLENRLNIKVVN